MQLLYYPYLHFERLTTIEIKNTSSTELSTDWSQHEIEKKQRLALRYYCVDEPTGYKIAQLIIMRAETGWRALAHRSVSKALTIRL